MFLCIIFIYIPMCKLLYILLYVILYIQELTKLKKEVLTIKFKYFLYSILNIINLKYYYLFN